MGYLVHQLIIHNDVLFLTILSLSVGLDPVSHFYLEMPLSILNDTGAGRPMILSCFSEGSIDNLASFLTNLA
jgi:hypothetical protein